MLWGQSAGARRTGEQSLAYQDDPIVKGYIQDSGALYDIRTPYDDPDHTNFTFVANKFGCTGSSLNLTACMQQVPQADVEAFIQFWVDTEQTPTLLTQQYRADNRTIWTNATEAILSNSYTRLPKIIAHMEVTSRLSHL